MLDQSLIDLSLQALSKHKISIDRLDSEYKTIKEFTYKVKEDQDRELDAIEAKLKKVISNISKSIDSAVSAIDLPVPKDGKDFDKKIAEAILEKQFNDYVLNRDISIEDLKKSIIDREPTTELLQGIVETFIAKNHTMFKGDAGVDGSDGTNTPGFDGEDGISIADIKIEDESLIITMTSGEIKQVLLPKTKGDKRLIGGIGSNRSAFISKNKDVKISNPKDGDLLVYKRGTWFNEQPIAAPGSDEANFNRIEIENMFKLASNTAFKELSYTSGNITSIDVYKTSSKLIKLFTKTIQYNIDNNISITSLTDEINGGTMIKTMAYNAGDISSISSTYTT